LPRLSNPLEQASFKEIEEVVLPSTGSSKTYLSPQPPTILNCGLTKENALIKHFYLGLITGNGTLQAPHSITIAH
jgi:hypothetical protein